VNFTTLFPPLDVLFDLPINLPVLNLFAISYDTFVQPLSLSA
jgi:hypothetical protein